MTETPEATADRADCIDSIGHERRVVKTICFVVATKDRPNDLRRMLDSLAEQTSPPALVILVDSSAISVSFVVDEFRKRLNLQYLRHQPPSASGQRNAGIQAVPRDIDFVAFLDDDATLEPDALEKMLAFWATAPSDVGGATFNMVNHPAQAMQGVKRWPMVKALGLYTNQPGRVTRSGWQTMIGFVPKDLAVEWLPSGAVVWRAEILKTCRFDEFFEGYSYLEDLDFSYTLGRGWRLTAVAGARYNHYPSTLRHSRPLGFGKTEVRNRFYLVRKHGLSYSQCWLGLILRMGMTLCYGVVHFDRDALSRVCGNCLSMAAELKSLLARSNRAREKDEARDITAM